MANLTTSRRASKPKKPRADFPLFPHARGYWAKKVRGKLVYFGKVADDPEGKAALDAWLDQRDELLAGRTPRAHRNGLMLKDLANRFLTGKRQLVGSGELSEHTFRDYLETCNRICDVFGKSRLVDDLASEDFESLRKVISKIWGPVAIGNEVNRVRVVFKYAYDASLIDKPVRYGPHFKRPSKKTLRLSRAAKGPRMFDAAQLRRIIAKADQPLKAMILLGANAALGNTDCGNLEYRHLDLKGGWINYPRPKTGLDRRAKLWPETVSALKQAISIRPDHKSGEDAEFVFITKYGGRWSKATSDNPVSKEMAKLLISLELTRPGVNFYALRHTFATIAGQTTDQVATNFIMGHADSSMAATYRERIDDDRLKAVSDHVRKWLFSRKTIKAK